MFLDIFKEKYYDALNASIAWNNRLNTKSGEWEPVPHRDRGDSLLKIFSVLESEFPPPYNIVETGTTRSVDGLKEANSDLVRNRLTDNEIESDRLRDEGSSTLIFDEFVNYHDGSVISIDINKDSCEYANGITSDKTQVIESDSIKFLWENDLSGTCLFYLDSYDVDFENPILANFHHMKELVCISKYLRNCIVVVDDCKFSHSYCCARSGTDLPAEVYGKGLMVKLFMENIEAKLLHDGYQQVWKI